MARRSPPRTFTLTPASDSVLEALKPDFGGNASAVVNASLRMLAETRGLYHLLGIQPPTPDTSMELQILHNGSPLRTFHHEGTTYAEAPTTGEYSIKLINRSTFRHEVVLSVDGIDAVNGKDATYANRGWVINPGQEAEIKGWFRSHTEVAAFLFAAAGSGASYAEKTGRGTANIGVISAAIFNERQFNAGLIMRGMELESTRTTPHDVTTPQDVYGATMDSYVLNSTHEESNARGCTISSSSGMTKTSGGLNIPTKSFDVGTSYGKRTEMRSGSTSFTRASTQPVAVITVRYATREALRSWGVPVDVPAAPNPWPANVGAPAPIGWTG